MTLFPYNKAKTKANVHAELLKYRTMARLADEEFVPSITATFSFELKSFTGDRPEPIENYVTRKIDAETYLLKVSKAMNKLNAYDRQILWEKYCNPNEPSDKMIYMNYEGKSERTFYRELEHAQQNFAEAYDFGRLLAE